MKIYKVLRLVFEILVQGSGYLIFRVMSPSLGSNNNPSNAASTLIGLLFWGIIGALVFRFINGDFN